MYSELFIIVVLFNVSYASTCLFFPNLNLVGGTYDEIDSPDKMGCCIACANNPCCLGYTYSLSRSRCYLKSAINYSEENDDFVGGVKTNLQGKAASLKNVKLAGAQIAPNRLPDVEDCKAYCTVFGIFTYSPPRRAEDNGMGSCICMSRIVSIKYEHGCHSFISPAGGSQI